MTSRRGFFGLMAGLAAAPVVAPLAKMFPEPVGYTTYLFGESALISIDTRRLTTYRFRYTNRPPPNLDGVKTFRCGTGELGTLYWSKNSKIPD